ncbi:MAG: gliding motility-associated C-terminal domain-containing protein [Saprospiraceae bacterium]|nr:gliding motility-associated C-terminal domain-containing protein [Saprospiraceae bacterium]
MALKYFLISFCTLVFYQQVFTQSIKVNSLDDTNDGTCNATHCSLREAIILANTYTDPVITFDIAAIPWPYIIKPVTNLPKIQSNNPDFSLLIHDPYGQLITISGELLPGKNMEQDYGLEIDTKGKVDIKSLSFRDFSRALVVSNVDTIIIGGSKKASGIEEGNEFFFNTTDLLLDGGFQYAVIMNNCFGSNRYFSQGLGAGKYGIRTSDNYSNPDGKLIIGGTDINALECNWFSELTSYGIDLSGINGVEISGNFFDTDRSVQPIIPACKNNIRLTNCSGGIINGNYLGASDVQMTLTGTNDISVEQNNFGTINYFLVYGMNSGLVLDQCENIKIGKTGKGNNFKGLQSNYILAKNNCTEVTIANNIFGIPIPNTLIPEVMESVVFEESQNVKIDSNLFIGSVMNDLKISKSANFDVLNNDFSVFDQYGKGGTAIYIDDAHDIRIGDTLSQTNNIFYRLSRGIQITGNLRTKVYDYRNSFYCNIDKGVVLDPSANIKITPPEIYKRKGNTLYGKSSPNAKIQIYSHSEECADAPCQGKIWLGNADADNNGYWSFDFAANISSRKTFTATLPDVGSSEFSDCLDVSTIGQMSLNVAGSNCDSINLSAAFSGQSTGVQFSWIGPGGFLSGNQDIIALQDGWYAVSATHPNWNYVLKDSTYITLKHSTTKSINQVICSQKSISIEGHVFDKNNPTGQFVSQQTNSVGCDSIIQVSLSFTEPVFINQNPVICPGESYTVGDSVFTIDHPEGIVLIPSTDDSVCDTVVHVKVEFLKNAVSHLDTFVCRGDTLAVMGNLITENNPEALINLHIPGQNGCDSMMLVKAQFESPEFALAGISPSCPGKDSGSIVVQSLSVNSPHYDIYLDGMKVASFSQPDTTLSQMAAGYHEIFIKDSVGCTAKSIGFDITEFPMNIVDVPHQIEIVKGEPYPLNISTSITSNLISWFPYDKVSCDTCFNPYVSTEVDVQLTFKITDINGCITIDSVFVKVIDQKDDKIFVPNIFSPNGDGINDKFEISGFGIEIKKLIIFNRWGGMVFNSSADFTWDGTIQGQKMDPGVYIFMLEYVVVKTSEPKILTGEVSLIR